jgi:ferrous iron transport protein B
MTSPAGGVGGAPVPGAPCCPPRSALSARQRQGVVARVALIGNPNVGKSTLFNAMTGARQHVGNWPGKTASVAFGVWRTPAGPVELVDLPGTYSLVPDSPDEALVGELLVDGGADRPDLVVAVLDAANLARNLYLLAQLMDTGVPVIAALTMLDVAGGRQVTVDPVALAAAVGVRVVEVGPRTGRGIDHLADAVSEVLADPVAPVPAGLGEPIESMLGELAAGLTAAGRSVATRWIALGRLTAADPADPADLDDLDDLETVVAERRYAWVHEVIGVAVHRPAGVRLTASDRVDQVLTSRWVGLPLFLMVMWVVFVATTRLAAPFQDGLSWLLEGPVHDAAAWLLAWGGLDGTWFAGLVLDGLVSGVGQLLTFAPLMTIMFVLLTVLEDSGYMARAAFVAEHFLRVIGLPGRAFLPLIVGFGCNVPAVSGTRILADARHRLMTSLLVPFASCSARLTVYVLLSNIFFGTHAGTVVFAMYVLSVVLMVLAGLVLRLVVFRSRGRDALVLELPPYRLPTLRVVVNQTWQKLAGFLRTASGIIVATVAVVWLLAAIPLGGGSFGAVEDGDSLYAGISRSLSVVFEPAGFGDGAAVGALVTGFVAKEAVVSTFAETYHTADPATGGAAGDDLAAHLRETFERSSGGHPGPAVLAFLVFLLAYTPCMATIAAQRHEIGGRWTLVGILVQCVVAWSMATLVFQIGRLFA